jgi:hypothetical protein
MKMKLHVVYGSGSLCAVVRECTAPGSEFFPCAELVTVHEPLTRLSIMFVVHFEGLFPRVIFCIDEDLLALTRVD